jgi:trypsin
MSHTLLSFFVLHLRLLLRRHRFLMCNNSLIGRDLLLTTAECFAAFQPGQEVLVGGIRLDDTAARKVTVSSTLSHPNLGIPDGFNNNLMLVKINEDMSGIVTPATLNTAGAFPADGASCFAIGYGATSNSNNVVPSNVLLGVSLPIISNAECTQIFGLENLETDDLMCAGSESGRGTCEYDTGSLLLCNGKIVGLTANFGLQYSVFGCGITGLPAVRIVKFVFPGRCE